MFSLLVVTLLAAVSIHLTSGLEEEGLILTDTLKDAAYHGRDAMSPGSTASSVRR